MKILGIETSCDETSVAIVENGTYVLANETLSSLKKHAQYGGVIPEIASRKQLELISIVTKSCLKKAQCSLEDIDAIAVTQSPGLVGSLIVGLSFAQSLSMALKKPLISVNHIEAHLYANWLIKDKSKETALPDLPAIGLVVSGGHTSLYEINGFQSMVLLGQTRDDAIGEAFDKVAKILGLGYPGGPVIDKLAQKVSASNAKFKCADLGDSYDFSFSGIKTGVLYYHQKNPDVAYEDIAYGFQTSAVNAVVQKAIKACQDKNIHTLVVGGGVAANSYLRESLTEQASQYDIDVYLPEFEYCLDNAAMIAGISYHLTEG